MPGVSIYLVAGGRAGRLRSTYVRPPPRLHGAASRAGRLHVIGFIVILNVLAVNIQSYFEFCMIRSTVYTVPAVVEVGQGRREFLEEHCS